MTSTKPIKGWSFALVMGGVIVIILAVVAAVASLVAQAADEAKARGQVDAVRLALAEHRALFADKVSREATDLAAIYVDNTGNAATNAAARLLWPTGTSAMRHDFAFLLDRDYRIIAQFPQRFDGQTLLPSSVAQFLTGFRERTGVINVVNPTWTATASAAIEGGGSGATDFLLYDGKPMIAAAAVVSRANQLDKATVGRFVILLDQIDLRMISLIARMHSLEEMRFQAIPPDNASTGIPLMSSDGATIGWIAWQRTDMVTSAFLTAAPVFGLLSAALICIAFYTGASIDRSNQRLVERERRARIEATHDNLTGLANRAQFQETLATRIAADTVPTLSILYIDLDGFKEVNDALGHHAGDDLLVTVGTRIRETVLEQGLVARLGGDEFAVLLPDMGIGTAEALAHRIVRAVQRMMVVQGVSLSIGASVGIATAPAHGREPVDLQRRADIALYAAKKRGRGQALVFEPEMERSVQYRRYMERDMRSALLTNEFSLAYQPIFSADGRIVVGVEALLRWTSPVRGAISPDEFIPIAEETGYITQLGAWALERACIEAKEWDVGYVSVNMSPVQMRAKGIVTTVAMALARSGLPAHRLVLEITEGVLIERADEALAVIKELQALGVGVALDDFGTGYSSLAYLKRFPFNKLKIDRTFVDTLESEAEAATIVQAIISLGRALGMTMVAEGVETRDQHRFLQAAGCHEMQGYHFARPMSAHDFARFIDRAEPIALSA